MKYITDDMGNKIPLRNKNAEILLDYVKNNFDTKNDNSYMSKLYHTFRVAEACVHVAKKLGLDEELAYNLGLLHDYARFYQWKTFKSFADNKTIDHADESIRLLFEKGEIGQFEIDDKDYKLLEIAIQNHNKKEINFQQLKNCKEVDYVKLLTFCKLIRDCDKVDIFYRLSVGDIRADFNNPGVSQKVIESIQNHKCVDKKVIKTGTDAFLTMIAYVFDFNFKDTLSYIDFENLWKGIDKFYCSKFNKEDRKILGDNIAEIKKYIDKQLASADEFHSGL